MALINSCVNGEVSSSISIQDRGFNYGDGVFETIAVINQNLIFWKQHFQRLILGCNALGIQCPTELELNADIDKLLNVNIDITALVIKIIITRGNSERGYRISEKSESNVVVLLSSYPVYPSSFWLEGIKITCCKTILSKQKQLSGVKHLNRLEQVLARQEWDDEFQEGLMSDEDGYVIEGVMSNLFFVKNNSIVTPCIENSGIDGIMRNVVLNLCESSGIIVKQDKITLEQVLDADEIFVTNSIVGIWPVNTIDKHIFSIGVTTKKLMTSLIKEHLVDYAALSL